MATTYSFINMKKQVASNVRYLDPSGNIQSSRDLTENDIGYYLNKRYYDIVNELALNYPEDYEDVTKDNFYKVTGTASASSTSTTLVASSAIFDSNMVGDTVYNSTDSESATITGYTNTTTVTLDTTIDDDWDGDTIYVLGNTFTLSGITDARYILEIGVQYDTSSTDYTIAKRYNRSEKFRSGGETYSQANPWWHPTNDSGSLAIAIYPEPDQPIDNAIQIRYLAMPALLSANTDTLELPFGAEHVIVEGATADVLRKIRGKMQDINDRETQYQMGRAKIIQDYALNRASGVPRVKPDPRISQFTRRTPVIY